MRGKRYIFSVCVGNVRITPADAGKTTNRSALRLQCQDHPRGCGENLVLVSIKKLFLGSPPRMRGKQAVAVVAVAVVGITPADAGKTNTHRKSNG